MKTLVDTMAAAATKRAKARLRQNVEQLRSDVAAGKRPPSVLEDAERWLPELEKAAETMIRVAAEGGR